MTPKRPQLPGPLRARTNEGCPGQLHPRFVGQGPSATVLPEPDRRNREGDDRRNSTEALRSTGPTGGGHPWQALLTGRHPPEHPQIFEVSLTSRATLLGRIHLENESRGYET